MGSYDATLTEKARQALDGTESTGENLRESGIGQAEYRALRDARSQARSDERAQEVSDPENRQVGAIPGWVSVRDQALFILTTHSKDAEVLVWLVEAETRLDGYAGLARSARLIAGLISEYGLALHPHPEDGEPAFSILAGLNGIGREGTLVQPLRLLPLVPDAVYGQMTLWDVESGRGTDAVRAAMLQAGTAAMRDYHTDVLAALDALKSCDRILSDLLGGDAPPFNQLVEILDDTERTVRRLAALEEDARTSAQEASDAVEPDAERDRIRSTTAQPISSRDQAFAELLRIAAYFRETEPHSPIGDSLETLVRRGRMDFLSLLKELVPDDNTRLSLMNTAGIKERPDTDNT